MSVGDTVNATAFARAYLKLERTDDRPALTAALRGVRWKNRTAENELSEVCVSLLIAPAPVVKAILQRLSQPEAETVLLMTEATQGPLEVPAVGETERTVSGDVFPLRNCHWDVHRYTVLPKDEALAGVAMAVGVVLKTTTPPPKLPRGLLETLSKLLGGRGSAEQ